MTDYCEFDSAKDKSRIDANEPGWSSLVAAIGLNAFQDYWTYFRAGLIKNGKFVQKEHKKIKPAEVKELLEFINSGTFTRVLDMSGVEASPETLRTKLTNMEKTGDYKEYFGSGMGQK